MSNLDNETVIAENEPNAKKLRSEQAKAVPATTTAPVSRWAKGSLGGAATGAGAGASYGSATPLMGMGGNVGLKTPSMNMASWTGLGAKAGDATPSTSALMSQATPSANQMMGIMGGTTPTMNNLFGGMGATPLVLGGSGMMGGMFGATPLMAHGGGMATPLSMGGIGLGMQTPLSVGGMGSGNAAANVTAMAQKAQQLEKEYEYKNRYLTDEDLDEMLPALGYSIVPPPPSYVPIESDRPNFYDLAAKALESAGLSVGGSSLGMGTSYEVPDDMGEGMPNLTAQDITSGAFEILLKYRKVSDGDIPAADVAKFIVMKQLLCIKNGDTKQRRLGMRLLCDRADVLGLETVITCLFDVLYVRCDMNAQEKHFMVKLTERLISRFADSITPFAQKIVFYFEPLLTDVDLIMRDDGKEVIGMLASTIGIRNMYEIIRKDIDNEDDRIRRHTAKVIAVVAVALGPEEVMRIVRPVSAARNPIARHTIVKAIDEMTSMIGFGMARVVGDLGLIFENLLRDPDHRVKTDAAIALSKVCEAVAPTGMSSFMVVLQIVREQCRQTSGKGKMLAAFLKALGSLVPLMDPLDAKRTSEEILPHLINLFSTPDDDLRRIVLRVVKQCLAPEGISAEFIRQYFISSFIDNFWTTKVSTEDRMTKLLLIATTVEVARKSGGAEVLQRLVPMMVEDSQEILLDRYPPLQELVLDAVREVVTTCGTLDLSSVLVRRLLENALLALKRDLDGTNRSALRGFVAVVNALKHAIVDFQSELMPELDMRLDNMSNELVRAQAADAIGMIAETLYRDGEGLQELRRLSKNLTERIDTEERAAPLAACLRALACIGKAIGCERLDPPPAELIPILKPLTRNRDPLVQQYVIELIEELGMMYRRFARVPEQSRPHAARMTPELHTALLDIATKDLFPLLASHRKQTKRACTRAFAILALVTTGFLHVAISLVENFTQDSRDVRICTANALAALADKCKPFTVIPFLINEYEKCEGNEVAQTVQHSVLKALRFILEEVGSQGKDYIFSLVPLIERAATEQSLQVRRMAMELIRAVLFVMVDVPVGGSESFPKLAIHLLNLAHPNLVELLSGKKEKISEDRLKLVSATVQVYEVARLIVGSQLVFQYLANGLFHPSEKIRDIFWRTYNLIYLANPEALIPAYPPLELVATTVVKDDENDNATGAEVDETVEFGRLTYKRHELYTI